MVNLTASAGEGFEFKADSVFVSFESCMSLAQHPAESFQGWGGSREEESCILFSGSHVTGPSRPPFPIVATCKLFLFIQKRLRDAGYVDNICNVQIYFIIKIPYNFVL